MAETNEWAYYFAALRGNFGPIRENDPQTGYYKHYTGAAVAIWREEGTVLMLLGADEVADLVDQGRIWLSCAKKPVSHDHYVLKTTTGIWPGLPEAMAAKVAAADLAAAATDDGAAAAPGAGHNSADLDTFAKMRAELTEEVSESAAFFAKHPVKTKDEADRAQDWGDRIDKAAKAADAARLAETKPLRDQIDEINARWNGLINPAKQQAVKLKGLAQEWGRAEAARLRKIAEDEARAKWESEQAEIKRQREAELAARKAAAPAHEEGPLPSDDELGFDLPPAPPPQPIVTVPKVMVGTGAAGNRRSVKTEPAKGAVIVDLGKAAAYLAEQKHPDLIALVQKLADKAAKSSMPMPGTELVDKGVAA